MQSKAINKTNKPPSLTLLLIAAFITLYINPDLQDPFNSPKMWILMVGGAWVSGYFLNLKSNKGRKVFFQENLLINLLVFFLICYLIAALFTDIKFVAFFGDSGRRLGFVTYLFLGIFMYLSFKMSSLEFIKQLKIISLIISSLLTFYGLLQRAGLDFIDWANPYNSIISTFGNPNFASAGMALFAVICFGILFDRNSTIIIRIIAALQFITLNTLIVASDSRQGILACGAGTSIIVYVVLKNKFLAMAKIFMGVFLILGIGSVLGMLQIGPLQNLLYKPSISIRGYYWRAALEMVKSNIWFGVGVDRYGESFKKFREVGYPLNYGFEITSSNAHSIPLQIFATSGILTGTAYLALFLYIFKRGLTSFKINVRNDSVLLITPFAAWITYLAQSLISIENIGLAIWGWILGGLVVGISYIEWSSSENRDQENKEPKYERKLYQPMVSGLLSILMVFVVSQLYISEKNVIRSRQYYDPNNIAQHQEFYYFANEALNSKFTDAYYKLQVAELLNFTDRKDLALTNLLILNKQDPKNLDFLRPLAIIYESNGNIREAIKIRKLIVPYDPWNCDNYLRLGKLYKVAGDEKKSFEMLTRIQQIAPNHQITLTAEKELAFNS